MDGLMVVSMSTPLPPRFSRVLDNGLLWILLLCTAFTGIGFLAFSGMKPCRSW
jgi:hypothetical protein